MTMTTIYAVKTQSGFVAEYPGDPRASRTLTFFETYQEASAYAEKYHAMTGETVWVAQA